MEKLLLLGGSAQQVIAIKKAKELGFYTILCDYLNDNPGQYEADRFYLTSTTDKEAVLDIAQKEQINGIIAYASDPAAPTAAYVAEQMGLPGNPYKSVEILCNKDKFRKFLSEHGFCTPAAKGYSSVNEAEDDIKNNCFKFPVIVKPVDSAGSKGVGKIDSIADMNNKADTAMSFSRSGRIIVEEFIEKNGYSIGGDGLSIDGKLIFRCFSNQHFNLLCSNPFVPISSSFPSNLSCEVQNKLHNELQRLISLLKIKNCTYNFEARIDKDSNIYIMEMAPRSGGNYIPQIIEHLTGVNLTEYAIKFAMGKDFENISEVSRNGYWAYYAIHCIYNGILNEIRISPEAEKHIVERHILKKKGDEISAFTGANAALGILIMKFDSMEQMLSMMDNPDKWIEIVMM